MTLQPHNGCSLLCVQGLQKSRRAQAALALRTDPKPSPMSPSQHSIPSSAQQACSTLLGVSQLPKLEWYASKLCTQCSVTAVMPHSVTAAVTKQPQLPPPASVTTCRGAKLHTKESGTTATQQALQHAQQHRYYPVQQRRTQGRHTSKAVQYDKAKRKKEKIILVSSVAKRAPRKCGQALRQANSIISTGKATIGSHGALARGTRVGSKCPCA